MKGHGLIQRYYNQELAFIKKRLGLRLAHIAKTKLFVKANTCIAVSCVGIKMADYISGWVNTLLSWKAIIPLSRLTYCAYLVHTVVMLTYYLSRRTLLYFTDMEIVSITGDKCTPHASRKGSLSGSSLSVYCSDVRTSYNSSLPRQQLFSDVDIKMNLQP